MYSTDLWCVVKFDLIFRYYAANVTLDLYGQSLSKQLSIQILITLCRVKAMSIYT